ncbi:hypothetical protein BCL76_117110 [Streptomyces sp. CG 926]|nr:hypothetical protein BCL76_117110 [Streptomyces sp. CG 926]
MRADGAYIHRASRVMGPVTGVRLTSIAPAPGVAVTVSGGAAVVGCAVPLTGRDHSDLRSPVSPVVSRHSMS